MEAEDRRWRKERKCQKAVKAHISELEVAAITKTNRPNLTNQFHSGNTPIGILARPQ